MANETGNKLNSSKIMSAPNESTKKTVDLSFLLWTAIDKMEQQEKTKI